MNIVNINSIFTIGFRCNSDDFLKEFLKIRKYASPFSFMLIDIKTALSFIDNKFENYTNTDFIYYAKKTPYKFNKSTWDCHNFIHKYATIPDDCVDILDLDKVCIWNHHNLYDKNTITSFNTRSLHLLNCLSNSPNTMLLFYIEKLQKYGERSSYFDKSILDNYNCNFLILIPLLNYNSDPFLFYDNSRIRIIYFNSNLEFDTVDIKSHREEWQKLEILINKLYNFNIEPRDYTDNLSAPVEQQKHRPINKLFSKFFQR